MNMLAQHLIVAVLVAAAAVYAVWLLLPARPRQRLIQWLLHWTSANGIGSGAMGRILVNRLQKAARRAESACGNCSANDNARLKR